MQLQFVAAGATNREVAERLFVSEATVKTHLLHIYAKLGVNDRAATVGTAFEKGLLTPGKANNTRLRGGEGGRELLHGRSVVLGRDTNDHQVETGLEQHVDSTSGHLGGIGLRVDLQMR